MSVQRLPKILLEGDPRLDNVRWHIGDTEGAHAIVGWKEWVGLPDLGIARIRAKIDTGARTSALHAMKISQVVHDGQPFARFALDRAKRGQERQFFEAPIIDQRTIKSSNGTFQDRLVIATPLALAGRKWSIEVTLTDRSDMDLPMLVGRSAMEGRLLVDPDRSYLWNKPRRAPNR